MNNLKLTNEEIDLLRCMVEASGLSMSKRFGFDSNVFWRLYEKLDDLDVIESCVNFKKFFGDKK